VISGIAAPIVTHTVTVEAAPGEANALTLTGGRDAVVVRDAGAPLTAGKGCRAVDAATVRCRTHRDGDTFVDAVVRLGDGDDRAAIARAPGAPALAPQVEGGDGADAITSSGVLEGGPGNDRLTGTARKEGMSGGPGDDVLLGLGGDDALAGDTEPQDGSLGGPEGNDVLDGGPGRDGVRYPARRIPVVIDLGAGAGGSEGEQDTLIAIEDATGGAGDDTITGTAGRNRLDGLGGRDVIRGLAGADVVEDGEDLDAGPGDDRVVLPSGTYACGDGVDVVVSPRRSTPVPDGCERVQLHERLLIDAHPRVDGGVHVTLRTSCRCRYRGSLLITRGGRVLARTRVEVPRASPGAETRVTLVLARTREAVPGVEVTVAFQSRTDVTVPFRTQLAG
jgi:Ca2+-binding RTX toxin-like protein